MAIEPVKEHTELGEEGKAGLKMEIDQAATAGAEETASEKKMTLVEYIKQFDEQVAQENLLFAKSLALIDKIAAAKENEAVITDFILQVYGKIETPFLKSSSSLHVSNEKIRNLTMAM
jgi:hypothetical protein